MAKPTTPEGSYESISVRVPSSWLEELDAWRTSQPVPPKRSDVIKLAVMQFLKSHRAK